MRKKQDKVKEIGVEYEDYLKGVAENERTYIKQRLIKQICWYDCSAIKYKRNFSLFNTMSIFLTCILPCLTTLNVQNRVIAIVSTSSVIITTLVNAFDYRNLWIEYRMICERLKSTLHQYLTGTGVFESLKKEKQFHLLVALSEEYMSKELKSWNSINHAKEKMVHEEK